MVLVIDISGHGFGHLMQIAPVVRELREHLSDDAIVVRCSLPVDIIDDALGPGLRTRPAPPDIGMRMSAPHIVAADDTLAAYREMICNWDRIIDDQTEELRQLSATALLSDVAFTGLAAAQRLGLANVALCSLHWAEMVRRYLGDSCEADQIASMIEAIYAAADRFFVAAPRTSVPALGNTEPVGPLVRHWGRNRRAALLRQLRCPDHTNIGVIAFGGHDATAMTVTLAEQTGWVWLVRPLDIIRGPGRSTAVDAHAITGFDFLDLVASADAMLTKTGYGTVVECAHYGVPAALVARPDWPEAADIETWWCASGFGVTVSTEDLTSGAWAERLFRVHREAQDAHPPLPIDALGHARAATRIAEVLRLTR